MMNTLTRWCTLRLRIYSATLWWTHWPDDVLSDMRMCSLTLDWVFWPWRSGQMMYSLTWGWISGDLRMNSMTWGWTRWPEDELSELKKIWPEDVLSDLRIPLWPFGAVSDHSEESLSVLKINPLTWSCTFWPEMSSPTRECTFWPECA